MSKQKVSRKLLSLLVLVPALIATMFIGVSSDSALVAHAAVSPVDPNADSKVVKILNYYYSLKGKTSNKVLSGQYDKYGDSTDYYNEIYKTTGKYPAIFESNLWHQSDSTYTTWGDVSEKRQRIIDRWNAGSLIHLHMPIPNPKTRGDRTDPMTATDFAKVAVTGNTINSSFNEWLDIFADNMKILESNGVVVVIRPLHECNGGWFWYGDKDPTEYKKVYRYLVDYLINKKGVHNLLFAYTPSAHPEPASSVMDYYPGDSWVDIVGVDVYKETPIDSDTVKRCDLLKGTGKPFGFGEIGWLENTGNFSQNSKAEIIDAIESKIPYTVFWSSWQVQHCPAKQNNCTGLYGDSWVVTRNEVSW